MLAADVDTDIELKILEQTFEPIMCESAWCEARGLVHPADWYWIAPCHQGTIAVCQKRKDHVVGKFDVYACNPGCGGMHRVKDTLWEPVVHP